jgi:hypothetical protein
MLSSVFRLSSNSSCTSRGRGSFVLHFLALPVPVHRMCSNFLRMLVPAHVQPHSLHEEVCLKRSTVLKWSSTGWLALLADGDCSSISVKLVSTISVMAGKKKSWKRKVLPEKERERKVNEMERE